VTHEENVPPSQSGATSTDGRPFLRALKKFVDVPLGWMAQQGARCYVAGASIGDALALCAPDATEHGRFIVCPWDRPGDSAADVQASYRSALLALRQHPNLDCYLSIKFPSLGYDPARAEAIVALGDYLGIRVHFDALGPESVDRTLVIIERLSSRYRNIGATVSARWRRSAHDIERLLDLSIPIRLVKGQLPAGPAEEVEPRAGFMRLILSAHRATAPIGVASHDNSLVEQAVSQLRDVGAPYELEQLLKLPPVPFAAESGAPIRLYIPYGHGYPPYDVYVAIKSPRKGLRLITDFICGCGLAWRERTRCSYPILQAPQNPNGVVTNHDSASSEPTRCL
jgi:hypothetical protein